MQRDLKTSKGNEKCRERKRKRKEKSEKGEKKERETKTRQTGRRKETRKAKRHATKLFFSTRVEVTHGKTGKYK